MSSEDYQQALKLGKKTYRSSLLRGESPELPVLEQLLKDKTILSHESLGLIEIPLDQIAGTYYPGRQPTFSKGFLPLMEENTEFAQKWSHLCQAHLEEGIHTPIIAYEFMHRFYVVEGHKRVSVLKYFHAASIYGTVTRLIPNPEQTPESRLYFEFLRFYKTTGMYDPTFTREGDYDSLLRITGTEPDVPWNEETRSQFHSFYSSFSRIYREKSAGKLSLSTGDALLVYLNIYDYANSLQKPVSVLRTELSRIWAEICNKDLDADIHLILEPRELRSRRFSLSSSHLRIAFIHSGTAASSSWVYAHELGRHDLEAAFDGQVETIALDGADSEALAEKAIDAAIADCSDLIFTTSPRLLQASVKASLAHPKAKILNCSLNTSHPSIRTYYARMYEAKFLMGVIAGCMSPTDKIGYIADYPIYGILANINAFAIGAQMVNPHAQIMLEWSKTLRQNSRERLLQSGVSYISDEDMISAGAALPRRVGLYHYAGTELSNTALSFWRWGKLYENIVRSYLNRGWKTDASGNRAINYWWGMDTGSIDLICSRSLPAGTLRLVQFLQDSICSGAFHPFSSLLRTQDGTILDFRKQPMTPEKIITMNWLADCVIGDLPSFDELLPDAQTLVQIQGIKKL